MARVAEQQAEEWVSFPGGELEGRRPQGLCRTCREALKREGSALGGPSSSRPLCFACYRSGLDRARALRAAGAIDTASEARFQSQLPFEPVDRARLDRLKADRATGRALAKGGVGQYVDRRRHAQIEARHALQRLAEGWHAHRFSATPPAAALGDATHAAELQLPDAWLPFVVSR